MAEKLHQLIATKQHVDDGFEKIFKETLNMMTKSTRMRGLTKKCTTFDDDGQKFPDESKEVVTTVRERLDWFARKAKEWINFRFARDAANQEAKATFEFNGIEFKDVPVSSLLEYEDLLTDRLRPIYNDMPTRDMTKRWEATDRAGIFKYGPEVTYKHQKVTTPLVLYKHTEKHPAQIKEVVEDKQIAKVDTTHFSGEESSQFKADCLTNLDGLLVAMKKARCKANETEVKHVDIGEKIFQAIHGG